MNGPSQGMLTSGLVRATPAVEEVIEFIIWWLSLAGVK